MKLDKLLLDTHVFLWWRNNDPRLKQKAKKAISEAPLVFVSAVSAWEVAIKIGIGRLALPEPFGTGVLQSGFTPLSLAFAHAEHYATLPALHGDPFDRMLAAQAMTENLVLVTHDEKLAGYPVKLLKT